MLAFDREVRVGHHVYADLPIGDLIDALAARARRLAADAHIDRPVVDYPRGLKADDQAIDPSDIATAINDLFDRHGPMPMTADVGDCLFTAMEIENTALAAPGYYAGMGFGVPGGIGVAAATGRRPLVLVGDGAFQMTGWELGNCRRYGLDPIVVSSTMRVGRCCGRFSRSRASTTSMTGISRPSLPRSAVMASGSGPVAGSRTHSIMRLRIAGNFRWWRSCCHAV
jgi:hypothetical protein